MRAATLLVLLCSSTLIASPALAKRARQPLPPPGPIRAHVELFVNGVAGGLVEVELEDGQDAWVPVATLRELGLEHIVGVRKLLGSAEVVSLRSLQPQVRFELDEVALALRVTAAPELWRTTRLSVGSTARPKELEYRADPSAFLNYALNLRDFASLSAAAELGFSYAGALAYTGLRGATDGTLLRGSTYLLYDEREALRRWQLGDAVASSGLLGGSVALGGFTLRREFSLDPYLVRAALPRTTGYAETASTVEVYVNGALVRRDALPPGPYELSELPLQTGAGTYDTVVRDAFGRVQQLGAAYYYSSGLLAPGLTDYEYSVGFERLRPATESFLYGRPLFLGRHRFGVTDWLTAGARLEGGLDRVSGGGHATFSSPLGEFELAAAASRHLQTAGGAGSLAWAYTSRRFGAGALARVQSSRYATASLGADQDRALAEGRAFVTVPLFRVASVGAEYGLGWMRDAGRSDRLALRAQAGLFRGAHLTLSAGRSTSRGQASHDLFAMFSYTFDALTTASAGGSLSTSGPSANLGVQRSIPGYAEGFGYRLHANAMAAGGSGGAQLDYQASFGRFQTTMDWASGRATMSASAAGGIVAMDGKLFWTRPVSSAYALLKVAEVGGVRGYLNNQLVGTTDADGALLIPDLLAYHGNRLRVDDEDIPLTFTVHDRERTIAPPHRGGALVRFDIDTLEAIAGTVVVEEAGRRWTPSHGELHFGDVANPLGRGGEFYVEGVKAGTHLMELRHKGRTCPVTVIVPATAQTTDPVREIGEVICRLGTLAAAPGEPGTTSVAGGASTPSNVTIAAGMSPPPALAAPPEKTTRGGAVSPEQTAGGATAAPATTTRGDGAGETPTAAAATSGPPTAAVAASGTPTAAVAAPEKTATAVTAPEKSGSGVTAARETTTAGGAAGEKPTTAAPETPSALVSHEPEPAGTLAGGKPTNVQRTDSGAETNVEGPREAVGTLPAGGVAATNFGSATAGGMRIRVPAGSCLWRIARRVYGAGRRWPQIEDANPGKVRPDDQMIRDGVELWIPCEPTDPGCHPEEAARD